ncbi:DUF3313 family protein [Pelagicoccus mobilis]|uniref:DUF3313 family protein n=1 Tax=Pelagicoccus mobilis TaxID=415221 RepID=A0A934RUS5_9BACT|nr:DUF3313 family protein [Pelagicoccus mobilis]MBK1876821.1 DUF3313 family protein [Pelagicoccus mobilis]
MKKLIQNLTLSCAILASAVVATEAQAKKNDLPETTPDGLVLIKKAKNVDYAYIKPGVDLSAYDEIIVLEPSITFQKHWQSDINSGRMINRITDDDIEFIQENAKELFLEQFSKSLEKKGYPVVFAPGDNVLLVRPAIVDLEINAPDVDRTAGMTHKTYAEYAGDATLMIELYDSETGELLARAGDRQRDFGDGFGRGYERTQFTNINDARSLFDTWARSLANGLERVKKASAS